MKYIIGSLYTNLKTSVVDDTGMAEQCDGFFGAPLAEKLILKVERWNQRSNDYADTQSTFMAAHLERLRGAL